MVLVESDEISTAVRAEADDRNEERTVVYMRSNSLGPGNIVLVMETPKQIAVLIDALTTG